MINYLYEPNDSFALKLKLKISDLLNQYNFFQPSNTLIIISSLLNKDYYLKNVNLDRNISYQSVYIIYMDMKYITVSPRFKDINAIECFTQKVVAHFGYQDLYDKLSKINTALQKQLFLSSFLDVHIDLVAKILLQKLAYYKQSYPDKTQVISLYSLEHKNFNFYYPHRSQYRECANKNYQDFSDILNTVF